MHSLRRHFMILNMEILVGYSVFLMFLMDMEHISLDQWVRAVLVWPKINPNHQVTEHAASVILRFGASLFVNATATVSLANVMPVLNCVLRFCLCWWLLPLCFFIILKQWSPCHPDTHNHPFPSLKCNQKCNDCLLFQAFLYLLWLLISEKMHSLNFHNWKLEGWRLA